MVEESLNFLKTEQKELIDAVFNDIRKAHAPSYMDAEPELLLGRCQRFVAKYLTALEGNPRVFVDYMCRTAEDRVAEGYSLGEIHLVLDIFEGELWNICGERISDQNTLLEALRKISSIINTARDEIACLFLEQRQKALAKIEELKKR